MASRRLHRRVLKACFVGAAFVVYSLFATLKSQAGESEHPFSARHLLSADNRSEIDSFPSDIFDKSDRLQGGIALHIFITLYCFVFLALVCDDYFVPAVETICDVLHLQSDVAGATFMAIATSSPELFINIVGTFITEGDIGLGSIVGSAMFNLLAVAACCGLFGGTIVQLDWWPLSRDSLVYSLSVAAVVIIIWNDSVEWFEALVLISMYVLYIIVLYFNSTISSAVHKCVRSCTNSSSYDINDSPEKGTGFDSSRNSTSAPKPEETTKLSVSSSDEKKGVCQWLWFILTAPITFLLFITIPDCKEEKRKRFPFTFVMCVVWIALLCYMVSWMLTVVGDTFDIPDSVMGLTFLALGTSVPEAVSSVLVTRHGYGGMGISNSIGSNTFDILICLGVPWFIKTLSSGKTIEIQSSRLEYSAALLLCSLLLEYVSIALNGFRLDKKVGVVCLAVYVAFLTLACLMELNVVFPVDGS